MDVQTANEFLELQATIARSLLKLYTPRPETWRRGVTQIETVMGSVHRVVHVADRVPSLLIAIDAFWRPEGSEWPDWRRIMQWENEDLSDHPWSQQSASTSSAETAGPEPSADLTQQDKLGLAYHQLRKREPGPLVEDLDSGTAPENDNQKAGMQRENGQGKVGTTDGEDHLGSSQMCDGEDRGRSREHRSIVPNPSNAPRRADGGHNPAKRARSPSAVPSIVPLSNSACTTCISRGDTCVRASKNPTGACRECHIRKKRCSLLSKAGSRTPSRLPPKAQPCRPSKAPPPSTGTFNIRPQSPARKPPLWLTPAASPQFPSLPMNDTPIAAGVDNGCLGMKFIPSESPVLRRSAGGPIPQPGHNLPGNQLTSRKEHSHLREKHHSLLEAHPEIFELERKAIQQECKTVAAGVLVLQQGLTSLAQAVESLLLRMPGSQAESEAARIPVAFEPDSLS